MKLTPWFDGSVKPVRVGVYELDYRDEDHASRTFYTAWDGLVWRYLESGDVAYAQDRNWRGLAQQPKGKK